MVEGYTRAGPLLHFAGIWLSLLLGDPPPHPKTQPLLNQDTCTKETQVCNDHLSYWNVKTERSGPDLLKKKKKKVKPSPDRLRRLQDLGYDGGGGGGGGWRFGPGPSLRRHTHGCTPTTPQHTKSAEQHLYFCARIHTSVHPSPPWEE